MKIGGGAGQAIRLFTLLNSGGKALLRYEPASRRSDQALHRSKRLYARHGAFVFIAAFAAASTLGSLLMGAVCQLLSLPWRSDLDHLSTGEFLFAAVIVAPTTETLLSQMLPVSLLDQGKGSAFVIVTAIHALHNLVASVIALT